MKALSRPAAPAGETFVGRPLSSFTTRSGARRALPRADYGTVAEQSVLVGKKRYAESLAKQPRRWPGSIDI